jgi:hypothetical protein
VQLHNDHSISMVPLFRPHDKNSVRYRWKVPEQKISEFWLLAKLSANSNNVWLQARWAGETEAAFREGFCDIHDDAQKRCDELAAKDVANLMAEECMECFTQCEFLASPLINRFAEALADGWAISTPCATILSRMTKHPVKLPCWLPLAHAAQMVFFASGCESWLTCLQPVHVLTLV